MPAITRLREYWPLLAGVAALYAPTYIKLAADVWRTPESFHGALFFLLTLWMVWSKRDALSAPAAAARPVAGSLMLLVGLSLFVVARSQGLLSLEVMSQLPVLMGVLLIAKGTPALRALWFPIAFLLFLVPLPGSILDALLLPLKQFVSAVVAEGLFMLGYPIARNGVTLIIGPYQLLVADACAGLKSIIALSGIGCAYIYLVGHRSGWRNTLLVASVLPIAMLANVLRVACLVLITYHFGDAMGQRFHDIAGMAEVLFALGAFFIFDALIRNVGWASLRAPQMGLPPPGRGRVGVGVMYPAAITPTFTPVPNLPPSRGEGVFS